MNFKMRALLMAALAATLLIPVASVGAQDQDAADLAPAGAEVTGVETGPDAEAVEIDVDAQDESTDAATDSAGAPGPDQGLPLVPAAPTKYELRNRHSQKCADLAVANGGAGVAVVQMPCVAADNSQAWLLNFKGVVGGVSTYEIKNAFSGRCLEIIGGSPDIWASTVQNTCNGGDAQRYSFTFLGFEAGAVGRYQIKRVFPGVRCLSNGASFSSGAPIVQGTCAAGDPRTFIVEIRP